MSISKGWHDRGNEQRLLDVPSRNRAGDTTWTPGALAAGSTCFGATAVGLPREETEIRFREIITGLESVDAGAGAPEPRRQSALSGPTAIARIADLPRDDGSRSFRVAFGSVTDRVNRFMARGGRELGLIDESPFGATGPWSRRAQRRPDDGGLRSLSATGRGLASAGRRRDRHCRTR